MRFFEIIISLGESLAVGGFLKIPVEAAFIPPANP
jgi:hypothetical protein